MNTDAIRARWRVFRQKARNDELFLIVLATLAGILAAIGVIAMREIVSLLHQIFYGVGPGDDALQQGGFAWWRPFAVLGGGGLAYGLIAYLIRRRRKQDPLDVIEANALHGGVLSLRDGFLIAAQTVGSVGLGASVGLEAGVSQLGGAAASWLGRHLHLSRTSLRTMVGCGAAAAIAALFNAPIGGIFYALELVIGGYAVSAMVPVAVAAITATLTAHLVFDVNPIYYIVTPPMLTTTDYFLFGGLGIAAAAVGVAVMWAATTVEALFRWAAIPSWLRPALGGLAVAAVGLLAPPVLGSGHGELTTTLTTNLTFQLMLGLLLAKALASAISIGCGFRGGLFSASLLLGSFLGTAYWLVCFHFMPTRIAVHSAYAVVGIGAVAASVVGAPMTMILLVFETTTDYTMTVGVALAVIIATIGTRRWFGYSFSTWRFHLRGVSLKGAYDIGRMYDLTVRRVLDRAILRVDGATKLADLLRLLHEQRQSLAFVQQPDETLIGVIDAAELTLKLAVPGEEEATAESSAHRPAKLLTPQDRLSTALAVLEAGQFDAAPVVMSTTDPRLIGCVHEADLLRSYIEEADRMRREDLGGVGLFAHEGAVTEEE
ncbi:MAG TPA: chloride channel protein [Dongiaceae bacterium]|nr:chloride channel protein [Dongiaceae bacterium]